MSTWIDIKDRLPEIDKEVLLFWREDLPCDVGVMYKENCWQRANDSMQEYDFEPSFWMELPLSP